MKHILNIDTTLEQAYISIAQNGIELVSAYNKDQREHATFLQIAVKDLIEKAGISLSDLDAIAVTAGPGSYTGIRVGLASAKGLAYSLKIPLISINTLEAMADLITRQVESEGLGEDVLICPMIDARRMEVFTGIYDQSGKVILAPSAMILEENSFEKYLINKKMAFWGSGTEKWQKICISDNAYFPTLAINQLYLNMLSFTKYSMEDFVSIGYADAVYLKDFHFSGATN